MSTNTFENEPKQTRWDQAVEYIGKKPSVAAYSVIATGVVVIWHGALDAATVSPALGIAEAVAGMYTTFLGVDASKSHDHNIRLEEANNS